VIWVVLAAIGVPLWFCAVAILTLVLRNRKLRKRRGDIPLRLRTAPDKRWTRGHAVWEHDVLAFRGSPAMWSEAIFGTTAVRLRAPSDEERRHLRHIGDDPVIARVELDGDEAVEAAIAGEHREQLLGPYAGRGAASSLSLSASSSR
jgi:hypothetical protein